MKKGWWMRFGLLIFFTILSVMVLMPTVFNFNENSRFPLKSKVNLGLDLQGGLYLTLGIDFNRVYREEVATSVRKMKYILKDQGMDSDLGKLDAADVLDPKQELVLASEGDLNKAKAKIKEMFPGLVRLTSESKNTLQYALSESSRKRIEEQSLTKSIEVIRNRIDEFGVTEPEITSQGRDRIVIQLPGVKDIERAKDLIGKTAKLEFKMVNNDTPFSKLQEWVTKGEKAGITYKKGESFSRYVQTLNEHLKADFPAGYELAFEKKINKNTNEVDEKTPFLVESAPRLGGDDLEDARVQIDQQKNEPYVSIDFKTSGAKRFEEITGENIGKMMAIILDGNVYSAPRIQTKIAGGRAQITMGAGNYNKTMQNASDLALVLRAGALPVQLDFLEQRTVGPSLGQDSIFKAKLATLIGCGMVFLFVLIYYRFSGLIAIITLVLNAIFVMACLVMFEATLTLPGIAGIALTIGMAVDANIIVYERIREELRLGISNIKSVEAGFAHAFWTIVDANVTTALSGLCLLNFGTGPIRGFAVTLLIGLVITVYCSYYVSRILFDFYMEKVNGEELSI